MATYMSPPALPLVDIVTYRLNDKLVYVKPAATYEVALDIAQKEFEELADVDRDNISFAVMSTFGKGERCPIRISESAWPGAVSRLMRGEIINVYIRGGSSSSSSSSEKSGHRSPRLTFTSTTSSTGNRTASQDPPPQYLEVPKVQYGPTGTSTGGPLRKSSSMGTSGARSQPNSRAGSPNARAKMENRRSWFGSIAR